MRRSTPCCRRRRYRRLRRRRRRRPTDSWRTITIQAHARQEKITRVCNGFSDGRLDVCIDENILEIYNHFSDFGQLPPQLFPCDTSEMRRDGPLGVRGMPARVSSVDETAIQAKLRELRVAMARERTARTEVNATMEANGGRIWSSSRPSMLRSRDGGLKLRELTAEELERIQRAKDRAAVSDRAAAISAVTAGSARNRSGRRLDPLNSSVISSIKWHTH